MSNVAAVLLVNNGCTLLIWFDAASWRLGEISRTLSKLVVHVLHCVVGFVHVVAVFTLST